MLSTVRAPRRPRRRLTAAVLATTIALTATACSSDDAAGPQTTDHPTVVASTDVWGSVARAVAGDRAEVSSLVNSAGNDPHEFEPSLSDTAKIEDADVLVFNGGHYDAYMELAAIGTRARSVNASAVAGIELPDHDHSAHTHDSRTANEHLFYNLAVVKQVADQTATALAQVSPANTEYFKANAATFNKGITGLQDRVAAIKKAHKGTKVASTEPLSSYLLEDAGLVDIAPRSFVDAVENGQSPSAADVAKFTDLLQQHEIKVLMYNVQSVDPATQTVKQLAQRANVPVVEVTETLPTGTTDYLQWQGDQISRLQQALDAGHPGE
jgi:zinc/manganese transport system substrate-binding protein